MKKNTHPKYDKTTITCACGNVINTRSVSKDMQISTCSACHPFYTGQSSLIDAEGRVEQFRRKYGRK
jgi:large subunit ribosomal protein L31